MSDNIHFTNREDTGETTVNPSPSLKKSQVKQYVEAGYTYREIAEKMGFSSVNTVHFYAKGTHQHRLVAVDNSGEYLCSKCSAYFTQIRSNLSFPVPYTLTMKGNGDFVAEWNPAEPTQGLPDRVTAYSGSSGVTALERLKELLREKGVI